MCLQTLIHSLSHAAARHWGFHQQRSAILETNGSSFSGRPSVVAQPDCTQTVPYAERERIDKGSADEVD